MGKWPTLLAVILLSGCSDAVPPASPSRQEQAAPTLTAAPREPTHYYAIKDGGEYGYEQGISQDAKASGQVGLKILMFKYLGERDGVLQFHSKKGASIHYVVECQSPCEFVKEMVFMDGQIQRKEHMRAVEGSIAWAMIQDAKSGQLERWSTDRNGKRSVVWFNEKKGPQWQLATE